MTPTLQRQRAQYEPRWRSIGGDGAFGGRTRSAAPRPTPAEAAGGRVIDFTDSQDAPRFIKGERVRHPHFGRGIIRELTGLGPETKAVIEFESVGRKKVVLRYANLQKEL
jgi:DNA helicase-2/ATP-dependent DNA helicase PcrA